MAEGDTILRLARRMDAALGGRELSAEPGRGRGAASGVERLDGRTLERAEARGKHLLLRCGDLVLHSHLGMSGSWQIGRRGERWRKPSSAAWATLRGGEMEAVQFGGPTLRVLSERRLRSDPTLARLGPDVLAADFEPAAAARSLRGAANRGLGDALLDQSLVAGIGNIFKSEACFAAGADPWRRLDQCGDEELARVLVAARDLMAAAAERGRPEPAVYRRAGRPCPTCGEPIASRGQGDANRRTYWCPRCQTPQAGVKRAK